MDDTTVAFDPESETLASAGARIAAKVDLPPAPKQVGRYLILDELGHGAMGRVFRAYDPNLDRTVALKLLRDRTDAQAIARILREAMAMAQLSHPNVVQVFDAKNDENYTYLTEQLVEGEPLSQWLRTSKRTWPEVLAKFIEAGKGLHAAHRVGLVHRDFKPSNVLVGTDGRVLVTDFGIVLGQADSGFESLDGVPPELRSSTETGDFEAPLTNDNMVVGTPSYMPPEQHGGAVEVDHRSDQYAFCVALYEGLCGQRPYAGKTLEDLLRAKLGKRPTLPGDVPRWINTIVAQGLDPSPEKRFVSMEALLRRLTYNPSRRRRTIFGGLALAGVVAAGAGGYALHQQEQRAACEQRATDAVGVWDDTAQARVRAAIDASGLEASATIWAKVDAAIGTYVERWGAAAETSCLAVYEGASTPSAAARVDECLESARASLSASLDILGQGHLTVVSGAIELSNALPLPEDCVNGTGTAHRVPLPNDPALAAAVETDRRALHEADALYWAGSFQEALVRAQVVLGSQAAAAYVPLRIKALQSVGRQLDATGDTHGAIERLREGYWLAVEHHEDRAAALIANLIAWFQSSSLQQYAESLEWCRHADANVGRLATAAPLIEARILRTKASTLSNMGHTAEALEALDAALSLVERATVGNHPLTINLHEGRGNVLREAGRYPAAREAYSKALELKLDLYGRDHPTIATSHKNLGWVALRQGDAAGALERFTKSLDTYAAVYGPEHRKTADVYNDLGAAHLEMRNNDKALEFFERALAAKTKAFGEESPQVAGQLNNIGVTYKRMDQPERAIETYRRALRINEVVGGRVSPKVSMVLSNIGSLLYATDEFDEASEYVERSLSVLEELGATDGGDYAGRTGLLGRIRSKQGRHEQARALFEEALRTQREILDPQARDLLENRAWLALELSVLGQHARGQVLFDEVMRAAEATGDPQFVEAIAELDPDGSDQEPDPSGENLGQR